MKLLLSVVLYWTLAALVSANEFYTAVDGLEKLIHTNGEIIETLQRYIITEEQRLAKIRWIREKYVELHREADSGIQDFVLNPANTYLLIKRLTADLKIVEDLPRENGSKALIEDIRHRQDLLFPGILDFKGAATSLINLQNFYKLSTSSLARGQVAGTEPSLRFSANDCYELGRQAYRDADCYHSLLWMQEALKTVEDEEVKSVDTEDIYEYIAFCTYMEGNVTHAVKLTKDILASAPSHPRAHENLKFYEDMLSPVKLKNQTGGGEIPYAPDSLDAVQVNSSYEYTAEEVDNFQKLCRGEKLQTHPDESKLHCRLLTNNEPYLLLQPVKEEELSLKPKIVIYYDILSNYEIETIKSLARPRLEPCKVYDERSKTQSEDRNYKICKSAFVQHNDHILRIYQRISYITGLDAKTFELLHVINYGIGGQIFPHMDDFPPKDVETLDLFKRGYRIATWLNFMSDVDSGGTVVFPPIGVTAKPIKGSAIFWYQRFLNGTLDELTKHAGCPVLLGSKWVSAAWVYQKGQEFRRPCSLNQFE